MRCDYNLSSIVKFFACSTSSCYSIAISNNRWSINWIAFFYIYFLLSLLLCFSPNSRLFFLYIFVWNVFACFIALKISWREISSAFRRNCISITKALRRRVSAANNNLKSFLPSIKSMSFSINMKIYCKFEIKAVSTLHFILSLMFADKRNKSIGMRRAHQLISGEIMFFIYSIETRDDSFYSERENWSWICEFSEFFQIKMSSVTHPTQNGLFIDIAT